MVAVGWTGWVGGVLTEKLITSVATGRAVGESRGSTVSESFADLADVQAAKANTPKDERQNTSRVLLSIVFNLPYLTYLKLN
jgi:hypothetical protein